MRREHAVKEISRLMSTRGRPTREAAAQRQRALLNRALEMFLERGFENTTISEVAAESGVTRRTVYARFNDKRELFRATLENGASQMMVSDEALDAVDTSSVERALHGFVRLRVEAMLTPLGIQMQRFVYAEAARFPELVRSVYHRISGPTIDRVAKLLAQAHARGEIRAEDPWWSARLLMNMTIGGPITNALMTGVDSLDDMDLHIHRAIDVFLDGIRSDR